MGKGPGCNRVRISLADYQQRVGDEVMTVKENIYSFTQGSHNISTCDEIVFADEDQLLIPDGSNVTLYGGINIPTAKKGFGSIVVNIGGVFNMEENSLIKIDSIENFNSTGIGVFGTFNLNKKGTVVINTIKIGIGIYFLNANKVDIYGRIIINEIKNGRGLNVVNTEVIMNDESSIIIENVIAVNDSPNRDTSFGIINPGSTPLDKSFILNGGYILINKIEGYEDPVPVAYGIFLNNFIQNEGEIEINSIKFGTGFNINRHTINGGTIKIWKIKDSYGFYFNEPITQIHSFKQLGGQIQIEELIDSIGFFNLYRPLDNFTFNQEGGTILINKISNILNSTSVGFELYSLTFTQKNDGHIVINNIESELGKGIVFAGTSDINVENIQINSENNTGDGIYLLATGGNYPNFYNNGEVNVEGTELKYTIDGTTELFGQDDFKTYFQGDGLYNNTKPE